MEDVIRLLPDAIANQIAAGEVVQRPASVVKELVENAIDAQATHIQVVIKDAGKSLIQVIDDGLGMSATDARLSLERHATSKIRQAQDLFNLRTMGFRGEALASISAVAQVEIRTRRSVDDLGTIVRVDGGAFQGQQQEACLSGTTVTVKNLFYNIPARRNFLKGNSVEMRHIVDEVQRVALAHPDIHFSLYHNDTEIYDLIGGKLSSRIVGIFGKSYRQQLIPCEEESPLLRVQGYLGKPEKAKRTRGEQFFFVNQRFIKHPYLHHAVTSAFEGLIPKDSHPFYVLFLEIDPTHIDVNVHPQKTEIKFDDERGVYAVLHSALRKALSVHHVSPSLDFDVNVNFDVLPKLHTGSYAPQASQNKHFAQTFGSGVNAPRHRLPTQEDGPRAKVDWARLYQDLEKQALGQEHEGLALWPKDTQALPSLVNQLKPENQHNPPPTTTADSDTTQGPVFLLQNRYIVSPLKSGLLLVQVQAAQERLWYDQYAKRRQQPGSAPSQQILFPQDLVCGIQDYALIEEILPELEALGFDLQLFPPQTVRLKGIPADLPTNTQEQALLEGLLSQYQYNKHSLSLPRQEAVLKALARKTALSNQTPLSGLEMQALIDRLFASSNPNFAPDGSPIFVVLPLSNIDDFFKPSS
jgi:DNA mismatch repair protein MutL